MVMKWLPVLLLLNNWKDNCVEINPHWLYKQTWILINEKTDTILNETSGTAPLNIWLPDLYFNLDKVADIGEIAGGGWKKGQHHRAPLSRRQCGVSVSQNEFYACPGF